MESDDRFDWQWIEYSLINIVIDHTTFIQMKQIECARKTVQQNCDSAQK